jgi:ABC-type branched-subunit amino acid transport system ATPase component/ABC-type branched-subunit amino acid transport system permease subunit
MASGLQLPPQTLVVGVLTGLTYALLGAGLVLVYRATKVINFAHGQIGAFGAAVLAKLVLDKGWNFYAALALVLLIGAAVGAAVELLVVRRLFEAPRLLLFVATLGVSQVMLVAQYLLPKIKATHGSTIYPSPLPWGVTVAGVRLASPELMVVFIVPVVVLALSLFLTRSWYGLALRAAAENPDRAELSGISTRRVSTMVWIIAGALATLTAVLLNPVRGNIVGLPAPAMGPGLLLPALAAGLVGGLTSLPWTLVGGIGVGVLQSVLVVNYPQSPGVVDLALFIVIMLLVFTRGRSVATRSGADWSLAAMVSPVPRHLRQIWWVANLRWIVAAGGLIVAIALPFAFPSAGRLFLFSSVLIVVVAGLSLTVLTGWAGQLSLGQYAFVGLGAVTTTALVGRGYSFLVAVGFAAVAGCVAAALVGFPALRVRGLFLAVTTLAFAVATQGWLLRLNVFTGGQTTYHLARPTLPGGIDLTSGRNYYFFCLVVAVLAGSAVARLRRSGVGRSMIAIRDNEAAAASFGLSPAVSKLGAFALSGGLAAIAGALYAGLNVYFQLDNGNGITSFGPEQSLQLVAMTVIGGLGSVAGTVLGALYVVGLPALFNGSPLVAFGTSGIGLLVLLLYVPGGLASAAFRLRDQLLRLADRARTNRAASTAAVSAPATKAPVQTTPRAPIADADGVPALVAANVTVQFGGVRALDGVSIEAHAGEVVGLIGSNGAGKSTLMNVISGFQPAAHGAISLWGQDVSSLPAHERARLGMGRVFQDARLFPNLTVSDTIQVALESLERSEFIPSLMGYPPARRADRAKALKADEYIDFLGLGRYADTFLSGLSTGTRRIVELCSLLAQGSRLLLLDEPTAGVAQRETEAFGPLIRRIRAELGATIVIIEHDMPMVMSISDRIYCLAAGQEIAEGRPDDVRANPAVVAAYLGTDERAISRSGAVGSHPSRRPTRKSSPTRTAAPVPAARTVAPDAYAEGQA